MTAQLTQVDRWLKTLGILLGVLGFLAYAVSKFSNSRSVVVLTAAGVLGFLLLLIIQAIRSQRAVYTLRVIGEFLLAVFVAGYAILFVLVFFFQDAFANRGNSFFQPQPLAVGAEQAAEGLEKLEFVTSGDVRLRGWLVRNGDQTPTPLLIYFDGSGSEVSERISKAQELSGWSVALVNYRGFGESEGTPSQANVFTDALLIYDTLARRTEFDRDRIAVMGYSLGSGVAVHLAAQRPVIGTVLVAPYDRLTLIGLKQTPLYMPLKGIMKPYFDSLTLAPSIQAPLLCLVGSADANVPPERSRLLVSQWGGETRMVEYLGEDHELLKHENTSWADILAFLQTIDGR